MSDLKCYRGPNPHKRRKEITCLYCLNFTEERRNLFPHCSLRGMICKFLHGSSTKNCITFKKRTVKLSEQNTYSKHFYCNLVYFEQGQLAILLQYPPLHLQKPTLTQAHRCGFLHSPSLKQLSSFPSRGAQTQKLPTFRTELREPLEHHFLSSHIPINQPTDLISVPKFVTSLSSDWFQFLQLIHSAVRQQLHGIHQPAYPQHTPPSTNHGAFAGSFSWAVLPCRNTGFRFRFYSPGAQKLSALAKETNGSSGHGLSSLFGDSCWRRSNVKDRLRKGIFFHAAGSQHYM